MKKIDRITAILSVAACMGMLLSPMITAAEEADVLTPDADVSSVSQGTSEDSIGYFEYYDQYKDQTRPTATISLSSTAAIGVTAETVEGKPAVSLKDDGTYAQWTVEVPQSGAYSLYPTYYPLPASGKDIQVSVTIDGKLPFTEAAEMSLSRQWVDKQETEDGSYAKDSAGNDLRPEQIEKARWSEVGFADVLGMYSEPYLFYLEAGAHVVNVSCSQEAVAFEKLEFRNAKALPPHADYIKQYEGQYAKGDVVIRQEAEQATEKTAATLYPAYDRSTLATVPNDAYQIRLNTIGGSNWSRSGTRISWTADVKEAGLYRLSFRVRQNYSEGLNAYRRLYINGQVPFSEADEIVFPYKQSWYLKTLGDDIPLYVYLEPGDIITLECTSGSLDYALREVQKAVLDLNNIYREIIMITGTSPSIYQDYALDAQIPTLVDDLNGACTRLNAVVDSIMEELGKSSSAAATIQKAVLVFEELAADTFYIPDRLSNFKGNIESLASLLLTLGGQGVEIDCLFYEPQAAKSPKVTAGFFKDLAFGFEKFIATFFNDYDTLGTADADTRDSVLVWAGVGRDQAQIISRLIEEDFTRETNIPVVLNLVTGDATLIKATLAGKGPDVSLTVASTTPVNLAARGALVDLNQFDLSKLKNETYASAWTPFEYQGGTYAIPEAQSCDLLFYRTDIFESLGIEAPQTWDDFYHVLEIIQSNNLQVAWSEVDATNQGNSAAISVFDKFLFQNGGEYYNAEQTKTLFDTEVAYSAFEKTVELYRVYGLSRDISFFNRFRSGEAPMGIANYTVYAQLTASAPEIRGLWSFAQIPGTPKEDGTIDRTESGPSTGCVMMASAVKKGVADEAFAFMEWWCGADAQTRYAKELEGVMGIIGRIAPANRVALENLGWDEDELAIITGQLSQTKNAPQVLGNYTVIRSLTSALRGAINDKNTPRRSLSIYNKDINDEIARKRIEFKLDEKE